jgi:hypothetical protein
MHDSKSLTGNPSPQPPPRIEEGEEERNPSPQPRPRSGEGEERTLAQLTASERGWGRNLFVSALVLLFVVVGIYLLFSVILRHRGTVSEKVDMVATPEIDGAVGFKPPKGYVCYHARKPIVIDGKLDDEAWKDAPWTDDFVDIEGTTKPVPRFRTRVKMLHDDRYFYVAAELEEPHVWATMVQHDSIIFQDNDFEVFIDPNGDNHEYYEFEMNARNTTWDLLLPRPYKDGGKAVNSWEIPGMKSAVHVHGTLNDPRDRDRGWTIELAFPWSVLGELAYQDVPPANGAQWRVNFSRVEWKHEVVDGKYCRLKDLKEDNWVWSPQGVVNMHRPETWGYVQFSTAAPGTDRFRPDPTGIARHVLHRVYYAQQAYYKEQKCYARTLGELGLAGLSHTSITGPPLLETTNAGFSVTVEMKKPGPGAPRKIHIRQDALVTTE